MRRLQILAQPVGLGLMATCALAVFVGCAVTSTASASATTRYRSGTLHPQFTTHVAPGSTPLSSGLSLTGANVTATIVGALALVALAFVVVTLIRRRITT